MNGSDGFDLTPLVQAAAADMGKVVAGDDLWASASDAELAGLTPGDRMLIQVVTGEHIPAAVDGEIAVSFFALQIAADRLVGPLRGGDEIPPSYVEDVFTAYEHCPAGTPISGDMLDWALAYLAGRELALFGPDFS